MRYKEFAKRFNGLLDSHAADLGQSELASMLGTSQPSISRIKKGEMLPSDTVIEKIKEYWNVDLSAEVELARSEGSRIFNRGNKNKSLSTTKGVPYYDVDFIGGFDIIENDQTTLPSYYIDFKLYEKATCWCNITGHSMEPEISHGDIIALRRIVDWSFLTFGEIYAIVTRNDLRTVKRIGPGSSKDTLMLIPTNESGAYSRQEIDKKDIMYVYEVLGSMKRF